MSQAANELSQQEQEYFATRGESGLEDMPETDGVEEAIAEEETRKNQDSEARNNRTVPHGALHAEREEHKKTRSELQQLRAEAARMQQQLQSTLSAIQGQNPQTEGEAPPDPREDFLGFTRWQVNEINRLKMQIAENNRREDESRQVEQAEQALWNEWNHSVEQARADYKDVDDALNFLQEARDRQLSVLGQVDARFQDKGFRERQMCAELRDIVVTTFQQGKDPAKAVYEIAKAYGYGHEPGARFTRQTHAQSASRTLTATSGKGAGDPMLLETVADLSEEDFAEWYKNNKDTFRKMFGG